MKLSIIFPVYNECTTVATILDRVLAFSIQGLEKEVIIVEGGSTDGTREIIRRYEKNSCVKIILENCLRGKGAAVRTGLQLVTGDIVLIQDGDLEYSVDDYPKLIEPFIKGKADIVFGSRSLNPGQCWQYRRFHGLERIYGQFVNLGGFVYTKLFNLLYGTKLTDGATMFKLFRTELLKSITFRSNGFDFDWEIQAKLAKKGFEFVEIPVYYKARSRKEGKKIRFWRDGWKVFWAIVKFRFLN